MLFTSVLFALLALLMLAIALHGRVVERGRFCRDCKFNLAGIDTETPDACCPECGRATAPSGATQSSLRACRMKMMVVAIVTLLLSLGLLVMHTTGSTPSIYSAMPDRIVLLGAKWGSDEAFDELFSRLSASNATSSWLRTQSVEDALSRQADISEPWDPRWGEIISREWQEDLLSEEQIARFIRSGTRPELWIRNRYRHQDMSVGYSLNFSTDRLRVLNRHQPGYVLHQSISLTGGTYKDEHWENPDRGGGMRGQLQLPTRVVSGGSGFSGAGITVPSRIIQKMQPGDEFTVFVEFSTSLTRTGDGTTIETTPVRITQTVRVIHDDEPLVRLIDDPQAAEQIRSKTVISPITGIKLDADSSGMHSPECIITFVNPPRSVAGRLYLRHHIDGELYDAGQISLVAPPRTSSNARWSTEYSVRFFSAQDHQNRKDQLEAFQRVTRDGVVDVIFRTDPEIAKLRARISQVVQVDLEFIGVPVMWYNSEDQLDAARDQSKQIPASR